MMDKYQEQDLQPLLLHDIDDSAATTTTTEDNAYEPQPPSQSSTLPSSTPLGQGNRTVAIDSFSLSLLLNLILTLFLA
jgi:hypothetical protein